MVGLRLVTSMSEFATCFAIASRFGSRPAMQCSWKDRHESESSRIEWRMLWMMSGLKTLSSKWPYGR